LFQNLLHSYKERDAKCKASRHFEIEHSEDYQRCNITLPIFFRRPFCMFLYGIYALVFDVQFSVNKYANDTRRDRFPVTVHWNRGARQTSRD